MKRQSSSSPGTFLGKQNIQAKEVYYLPYLGVRFPQPVSSKKYSFLITFNSTPCSPPPPPPPPPPPKKKLPKSGAHHLIGSCLSIAFFAFTSQKKLEVQC